MIGFITTRPSMLMVMMMMMLSCTLSNWTAECRHTTTSSSNRTALNSLYPSLYLNKIEPNGNERGSSEQTKGMYHPYPQRYEIYPQILLNMPSSLLSTLLGLQMLAPTSSMFKSTPTSTVESNDGDAAVIKVQSFPLDSKLSKSNMITQSDDGLQSSFTTVDSDDKVNKAVTDEQDHQRLIPSNIDKTLLTINDDKVVDGVTKQKPSQFDSLILQAPPQPSLSVMEKFAKLSQKLSLPQPLTPPSPTTVDMFKIEKVIDSDRVVHQDRIIPIAP